MLYSGWRCGRINTTALIGQSVTVEFVVGDCTAGRHFGTVYIDDICNDNCTAPIFGSINLNSIQTINCLSANQIICGTFQAPFNSQYGSIQLNVLKNGSVVGTVNAPSTLNLTSSAFCFTVPQSAFGVNPTGNFEFQVVGNFIRQCTVNFQLDPIFDFSANDSGPDVSINIPILSLASISNVCPNSGVNLNSITASNQPSNASLTWHTANPANGSNLVNTPSNATAGTYYAAFFDVANNCYGPNSNLVTATVNQCLSDLSISKTSNNFIPLVGSNITFTLTATNIGLSPATGVVVTDNIPIGFTLVSATPSVGTWTTPSWNIGNLATGAIATISIVVTVNPLGSHDNIATITGNQTDPYLKNNTDNAGAGVIYAGPDNFSSTTINGCLGGNSASVLSNDWYNDAIINPAEAAMPTVSLINNGGLTGATINNNGIITVPSGSAFGTYTLTYSICRYWEPTICSQATVVIKVGGLPIVASNDNFSTPPINTLTGGQTLSVLNNDTFNGVQANNNNVTVSFMSVTPSITPLPTVDSNGIITLPPGTPIGTYTLIYKIVDNSCILNYTTATATILVNEQIIVTPQLVAGSRANRYVNDVDTQSTGKIIIAGAFTTYNSIPSVGIARLHTNLTFDNSFNFTSPSNERPHDMKVIKNSGENYNKIILVGSFSGFNNGTNGVGIIRLNPDGSPDLTFNAIPAPSTNGVSGSNATVYCCYIYPDGSGVNTGKILIGGMFNFYNDVPRYKIARLHPDGTLDNSFNPNLFSSDPNYSGPGFNSAPFEIVVQPNGKILVGGYFSHFNGILVNHIARLNDDGTIDPTFNTYSGSNKGLTKNIVDSKFDTHIEDIVLDNNNNIIIGGVFQFYNGASSNNIARLLPSGVLDPNFNIGLGFNNTVLNVPAGSTYGLVRDLDIDGTKIYVAGDFTAYQGINCDEVIRINSNGFRDNSPIFTLLNGGTNGTVWCMKRQGDGKIIIGGKFTTYNGLSALNVTRIFPSGASTEAKMSTTYYDSEPDVTELENDEIIMMYPNPTSGILYFSNNNLNQGEIKITIYSVLGQRVLVEELIKSEVNKIDLSALKNGTYFITFTTKNHTVTKTLIIK